MNFVNMSQYRQQCVADLHRRFDVIDDAVRIAGRRFELLRPRSADDLLDAAECEREDRLPYWAEIWPSAVVLAERLAELSGDGRRCLELGAGCGLPSLVAAAVGFKVTASDYHAAALRFVEVNAWHNKLFGIDTRLVDWHDVPEDLPSFDLVVGADVLYESHYPKLVAAAIDGTLAPEGEAIITDPTRTTAETFVDECQRRALIVCRQRPKTAKHAAMQHVVDTYQIRRR